MLSLCRSLASVKFLLPLLVCWKVPESIGFAPTPLGTCVSILPTNIVPGTSFQRFASSSEESESDVSTNGNDKEIDGEEQMDASSSLETTTSTLRIDDGGSNLTDRFKYKVHALMGDYDPSEGTMDDEDQDGNIMKALITFPTQHVFDVVGRINDETETTNGEDYAQKVKSIVFATTGDQDIVCEVIPRGKKFVKVQCEATVQSTTMINMIYDELGAMESTVMKF